MHTHAVNQKKKQYLFVVKIYNHHFWVNTSIQCFSNAFFSNVRSNLALYFKLKTTIISRKGMSICNLALPKNPSVWKVWIFSDKGQYKSTLALGHKYEVKTLSLSLSFSGRMSTAKRRRWHIPASVTATTTFNPIRSIVDRMKITPNPEKQMIALSIGKLFEY